MPTDKLTDSKCKGAKPRETAYKLFDGDGMALWVSPTGARVFRLYYRDAGGKQKTMSLGAYPEVSLAAAREKRAEARATLREGMDPMAPRRKAPTLREASDNYWSGRRDLSEGYLANITRALEMHVFPRLGDVKVSQIDREQLMDVLRPMDAAKRHVYVRKVRMWLGQVFDHAVEHGDAQMNPAKLIDPRKAFGVAQVEHFASLTLPEVGPLMQRIALEAELQSVLACRLLALTWTRTNELRQMLWSEVDGDRWRIPAGRMKKRRDHLVPLSKQAVAIIDKMRLRSRGSAYVFPSDRREDRPMSENAVLYLLHRIGYKDRMTGHGWRSVASTWANEHGYSPDAIERQLAHAPDDKTRAAYNHAAYLPERKRMLQEWANWLDQVEAGTAQR